MILIVLTAVALSADGGTGTTLAGTSLELGEDVRMLYDLVTCQQPPDAGPIVDFCKKQLPRYERFREHWGKSGEEFLSSVEPKDLPSELVYPFGGGDLMMALTAFPNAQVITTMSLKLAGDPRRIRNLKDPAALDRSLKAISEASASTLVSNDSKSINLSKIQQGELPGQLSMHLMGLALHDQVPVAARYFKIEDDGTLHYYSKDEVDALEGQAAKKLSTKWKAPDFSPAFANVEILFVPKDNAKAAPRTFRHIGADLSNDGLKANPGLLKHLESKGVVAVMTKAASYLLWNEAFNEIHKYLIGHARFMLSDSTGVLPRFWSKNCGVKTYGAFTQTFLGTWKVYQEELSKEFETQPKRALPFRFGYPDGSPEKKSHMMTVECAPEMIRGVIFDLDGTLLDSLHDIGGAMNEVLERRGYPAHPINAYLQMVGEGVEQLARRALPKDVDVDLDAFVADYRARYAERMEKLTRPYDGIPAMLDALTARGVKLAVLSNKREDFTVELVKRQLSKWSFVEVRGERKGVPRKPDPHAALALAQVLGLEPSECAFVGDTPIDVKTALAAGMLPVAVLWGFRSLEELNAAGAKHALAAPHDLLSLL